MGSVYATERSFSRPGDIPPLRKSPFEADAFDAARAAYVKSLWHSQDQLLRRRDRQVEENIRMLLGQQWIAWSDMRGRFVDLADALSDDEKRWRHMPVLNRLFLWFLLQHARMNENPPVISWQAGPDRIDAMLAEVMDPVFKYLWYDVEMLEVLDRLFTWLIPSGRAFLKSRIDPMKGDPIPTSGPAVLELLRGDGAAVLGADGQPIRRTVEGVPWGEDKDGEWRPRAKLVLDGEEEALRPTAGPQALYEGGIEVDVLTCLEGRGEWGAHIPWHRKAWHTQHSLLTPMQAWEAYGVELEPDLRGQQAEGVSVIWRLLHGSGLFGSADGKRGGDVEAGDGFVSIYEFWGRPGRFPGTERTEQSAGGRLLIVTGGGQVIRDGVRPAPFRYTSPIRCFDMVNLPGRPQGTSPQEFLNGPSKTRNRLHAQIVGHATLVSNPVRVVNRDAGIEEGQIRNVPGEEVLASRGASTAPVLEYVSAPSLGNDVYHATDRLSAEIDQIGHIEGTEGRAPTRNSSGELVKELRFNADRPIAGTLRRAVIELGRMAEDWHAMLPTIWDQEKIISIAGEDGIARVITVWPELFKQGNVNAKPEIESMLPESRQERQQRAFIFWQQGVYGPPNDPSAISAFLDEARFPHMSRIVRPGGTDRATAEQAVGRLLQGELASSVAVFPWYDLGVHLLVLERFMKSPEYLKLPPETMTEFVTHWTTLREAQAARQLMDAEQQIAVQGATASRAMQTDAELATEAQAAGLVPGPPDRGPSAALPGSPHAAVA